MRKDFELLPHTADLKLRVYGETLAELFTNAIVGMFQSIGPHAQGCVVRDERLICDYLSVNRTVDVSAQSVDLLLVEFLSEALYLSDVYNEAYLDTDVEYISQTQVKALLKGVPIEGFDQEIKAVTYHELLVKQTNGLWVADVLFDI